MPRFNGGGHKVKVKKVTSLSQSQKVYRAPNPVIAVVTWGVNHSMREMAFVAPQPLIMDADFKAFAKIAVHNHGYNTSTTPNKFSVKEYCPVVFRDLRQRFGVDPDLYLRSFCSEPAQEIETSKKSQSGLYRTHDSEFLLQTMSRNEVELFHKTFPAYHAHIVEHHGETLLPHFLGLFRVNVSDKDHYILLTRNVQSYLSEMHETYDLKGSTVDRDASDTEKSKTVPMFKDGDFKAQGKQLHLDPETKAWFLKTLCSDVEFLAKMKMMDYSLLVGFRNSTEEEEDFQPGRDAYVFASGSRREAEAEAGAGATGTSDAASRPSKRIYMMGLVNVLTKYGARKKAAHNAKSMKHGQAKAGISTVNPDQYMQRFTKFISSILEE